MYCKERFLNNANRYAQACSNDYRKLFVKEWLDISSKKFLCLSIKFRRLAIPQKSGLCRQQVRMQDSKLRNKIKYGLISVDTSKLKEDLCKQNIVGLIRITTEYIN